MIVGFTGTRNGLTDAQRTALNAVLTVLFDLCGPAGELRHGDLVGADAEAHAIARKIGLRIVVHPPDVDSLRAFCQGDEVLAPTSYPTGNKRIVDAAEMLIACPAGLVEETRSGTWSTVRYCRQRGKPIYLVLPDGAVRVEGTRDQSTP
jgi:hypothetical protein